MSYFVKDAYMFSFDFKSGYHRIDIAQGHQTFLRFSWQVPDSIKEIFYVFTVLAFGVSSAPYVFKGFEAFRKVLENARTLYSHLLG